MRGLEVVEFACGVPDLLKSAISKNVGTAVDSFNLRQPLGVVAGITPFNFPAMVPMWMFPIALACGNTFILQPSERYPPTSVLLAELLHQAGLPDGVCNVLHGDFGGRGSGRQLRRSPGCDACAHGQGAQLGVDGRAGFGELQGGFCLGGSSFDRVQPDMRILCSDRSQLPTNVRRSQWLGDYLIQARRRPIRLTCMEST